MIKKELRKEYLAKRKALLVEERDRLQKMLVMQLDEISLPNIRFAMSYLPISSKAEIHPAAVETFLKKQFPNCRICYPKTKLDVFSMEAIAHVEGMALAGSELGIEEPISGEIIAPEQIDVVIVPLLAFDKMGYRIGYGKGFYDRFINRCREDVITIGLSFFEPVENIKDKDEYDVPLKYCVTPQKLHRFPN